MIGDLVGRILNFFAGIFWEVMKFLLGLLEALEYMISNFLGIVYDSNKGAYKSIDAEQIIEFGKAQGFFDTIVSVFKALLISSIILVVIFTIYAIIKQEIANAQGGFEKSKSGKPKNEVMPVVMAAGKHILMMALIPFIMIFLLQGVNSVLASFRNAFSAASGTTIAGQVLASSTYDANKYRTYANANQRIPIIIETYNPDDFKDDEKAKLLATIKQLSVQNKLKNVATNLAYNTFLSFGQSATYENNKLYNSERYESYYEKFVCTREQYQVLADFVDYAQLNGMNYYVKSMDDPSVDWGYVSSTIYNSTDNSLTITYSDGSDFDKDGKTNDVYNLVLAPENKVVSPISDTLDSIMAMLGIGKYGDNVYK